MNKDELFKSDLEHKHFDPLLLWDKPRANRTDKTK